PVSSPIPPCRISASTTVSAKPTSAYSAPVQRTVPVHEVTGAAGTERPRLAPARLCAVSVGRLPLFCDIALAGRIERAEAQLVAAASEAARRRMAVAAGFVLPIAGGVASFAEEGSAFNKVAGLGFGGVPDAAALEEIER